ncbi:MAG: cyclic nucleotide-binding domain-containing protein [Phycisphaerae bacterium]|nr:cyclic nucleotide-binding domain-containing protein [Phycisphaerae bacterium]
MSTLDQTALEYLYAAGREVRYGDGEIIVHRGRAGEAFFVVLSGVVEVLLEASDGRRLPLTRLGEGATFGEMSLLTDEPVSADVVARGDVELLVYPGELFQTALAGCVELRNHIMSGFCASLRETNVMAWRYFQRSEVLETLMRAEESTGEVVVESRAMRNVEKQIAELGHHAQPVLITGDAGVGKLFVARKIHESVGDDSPLVVVDCSRVDGAAAGKLLFGPSEDWEFHTRSGASGSLPLAGALDLADRGTLVLRHVDALPVVLQEVLGRYAAALDDSGGDISPRVRLLVTTRKNLQPLAETGAFSEELARRLLARTLAVPALVERKRDILPLARLFLAERDPEGLQRFNTSAENALVSAQFQYRNVAELREAVEFSSLFADGEEISSEHIFTGPRSEAGQIEYDLFPTASVQWFLSGRRLPMLRLGVLVMFLAITIACLAAGETIVGRVANGLVWGLWWPFLIIAFLLMGRLWCAICPIALIGRIVRRLGCLGRKPPEWMKKYSGPMVLAGFLLIIWFEHCFRMIYNPAATGWLLLALMGAATVSCLIYQRESWCRYMCPLGGLGAGYAAGSTIHVRANPNVCVTQCTTHECFKGVGDSPGCPVFHHPMYASDGQYCKMCMECLNVCPHGSARLYLRPPLQGIWRVGGLSEALAPFASVMFFAFVVMLASHRSAWVAEPVWYTGVLLAAVCAGLGLHRLLRRLFGDESGVVTSIAFALFVLGAGPLMAFHLQNIPFLDTVRISMPAEVFAAEAGAVQIGLLEVLQFLAILISAAFAAVAMWRIRIRIVDRGAATWGWRLVDAVAAVYLVGVLALLFVGDSHT